MEVVRGIRHDQFGKLVNDGLDSACHNNHRTPWTYNQGVILGGLAALAKQTGEAKPLEAAQSIALAAIARLTDLDGILHDSADVGTMRCNSKEFFRVTLRC